MAEKESDKEIERIYIVPLRKAKIGRSSVAAPRAVKQVRSYLTKHMKVEEEKVWIDDSLNHELWSKGKFKTPNKVRVRAVKFEDGVVEATIPELGVKKSRREILKEEKEKKLPILRREEEEAVTKIGSASSYDDISKHKALILEYQGKKICLDTEHTHCRIGRGTENDLCVEGKFTSRLHAEIVFMHGIFHLRDISTNGTALIFADGRSTRLHREEAILSDKGTICFGGLPENDPAAAVHFQCEIID